MSDHHSPPSARGTGFQKTAGFVTILSWIAGMVFLLIGGHHAYYLSPGLWPLLGAGLLLLLAALVSLLMKTTAAVIDGKTAWIRSGLLLLPLVYLAAVHGESLGIDALNKRLVGGLSDASLAAPLDLREFEEGDSLRLDLHQVSGNHGLIVGRTVLTLGQVAHDPALPKGCFVLFRFVINCCVADALPVAVLVKSAESELPPEKSWLEVEGRLIVKPVGGRLSVVIEGEKLRTIERPTQVYLTDGSS